MNSILLLLLSSVSAADIQPPGSVLDREGVRLCIRGVGEAWQDGHLTRIYRGSLLTGAVGVVVPVHKYAAIDIEAGYKRQAGTEVFADEGDESSIESAFEIVPLTLSVEGRLPLLGGGELFLGLGPTLSVFTEEHSIRSDNGQVSTQGMKVNMDSRFGVRVDSGLFQPSLAPVRSRELKGIDLEIFVGRRWQFGPDGFDLSAWRGGLGFAFKL